MRKMRGSERKNSNCEAERGCEGTAGSRIRVRVYHESMVSTPEHAKAMVNPCGKAKRPSSQAANAAPTAPATVPQKLVRPKKKPRRSTGMTLATISCQPTATSPAPAEAQPNSSSTTSGMRAGARSASSQVAGAMSSIGMRSVNRP